MLLHPYQTLVREIATPTIPAFINACLQLIKPTTSGQASDTPLSVVETVCDAFSALIPLYPTTFRPKSSQIRNSVKLYVAPTQSNEIFVPQSLQSSARRLVISLHHVAAKSGGSDEWAKLVDGILKDLHATADQVFRAVDESWEGSNGYGRSKVELDEEVHGGGSSADALPSWVGMNAGVDRLIGLFQFLSESVRYPTKTTVTIPTNALVDAASRVCLIARLSPKSQTWDQALQTKAAVGREEKEDLWSSIPEIHCAAFELIMALIQRLGQNMVSLMPEVLDHLVRVFKSGINIPTIRITGYTVLNEILKLMGPTLSKTSVDMLDPLIGACCRDLQQDAGHLKQPEKPSASGTVSKKGSVNANADLFLKPQTAVVEEKVTIEPIHKAAAATLLATIPSRFPQKHLKPSLRGLLDQTAILTGNRDAMLGSVLNPYKDQRGRVYPSILPHLTKQFPEDQGVEVLRTNLRTGLQGLAREEIAPIDEEEEEELGVDELEDEQEDEEMQDDDAGKKPSAETTQDLFKPGTLPAAPKVETLPIQSNPFEPSKVEQTTVYGAVGETKLRAASPPKRKHEGNESAPTKRQVLEKSVSPVPIPAVSIPAEAENDDDDDSDVSVHLNMELEDDEDEDDDEE